MKFIKPASWFYHGDDLFSAEDETSIPKLYRYSYTDFLRDNDIYYPLIVNYIVRWARKYYWKILGYFYWIGLIDTGIGEEFQWRDFFRIKIH